MKGLKILVLIALVATSCSASRNLPDGSYRLVRNDVITEGGLYASDLSLYIKQQPNSYLFLNYNPFKPPVVYDSTLVEKSKENIANHLANLGYYHPVIKSEEVFKRRKARIVYKIVPGPQKPISSVAYEYPDSCEFAREFVADTVNSLIKPGVNLSEYLLENEVNRCVSAMRNKGFYSFSKANFIFTADTLNDRHSADLTYRIQAQNPIEKCTFGKISFSRPEKLHFRNDILKRFNTIKTGDTYSETTVSNTYSNLLQLRAFNTVNISTQEVDENKVDCDIRLTSDEIQGFKVNLEGSFTSTGLFGISPNISYFHKNIFGGSEWLNLGFSGNFQAKPGTDTRATEFSTSASLSFPFPKFRMECGASYNYQNRPEFIRNIFSGNYGFAGKLKHKYIYQFNVLQINAVYLVAISENFLKILEKNPILVYSFSNHYDVGVGGTLYFTNNTDMVPKTSFRSLRLAFDTSGNILGLFKKAFPVNTKGEGLIFGLPFSQYVKADVTGSKTIRFGKDDRQAIALRAEVGVGLAYGNSTSMPYDKQFYVGGANSMRGWQARAVGPGDAVYESGFSIPSQTGDFKFEIDAEYRFPLFWKMEGATFLEAGNVWYLKDMRADFLKSIAADWGFGLRVNLDFIVLRLDLGVQLYDPSLRNVSTKWIGPGDWFRTKSYALHFGVGYPF